jgi:hypothetical protein
MSAFRRPLRSKELINLFLKNALELPNYTEAIGADLVDRMLVAEEGIDAFEFEGQTLSSDVLRAKDYFSESQRWALRESIANELKNEKRLKNDDDIRLGEGGALPITDIQSEKQAFLIIGPPAAGKSTLSNSLSDTFGAIIVDSDYVKRKLPEFFENSFGATIVNEESRCIAWGFPEIEEFPDLISFCVTNEYNLVAPMIGGKPGKVLSITDDLQDAGYNVHLLLVSVSRQQATVRALRRFYQTGRYVPPGYIFDEVGNDPAYCYYYLRTKYFDHFDSMGSVTARDGQYFCLDSLGKSPAAQFVLLDILNELP